ncbi:MAG: DUF2730 family protein [Desulfovibrionaceae bacterium]
MMTELLQSERLIIAVAGAVGAGMATVFWFAIRKFFVTRHDHDAVRSADAAFHQKERAQDAAVIQKLSDSVNKLTDRMVAMETRVNALPTETMLNKLNISISELAGAQQAQQGQLNAMNNTLMLIQQHLLESR